MIDAMAQEYYKEKHRLKIEHEINILIEFAKVMNKEGITDYDIERLTNILKKKYK